MKASVKYRVINRFKEKYNMRDMCIFFGVSRSGYYAWTKKADKEDPDKQIGELIRDCQKKTRQTYGYRRVQIWLLREFGLVMNHKAVLRVMNKYNLLSKSRRKRKWVQTTRAYTDILTCLNETFMLNVLTLNGVRTFLTYQPKKVLFIFL